MSIELPVHACGMRLLLTGEQLSLLPDISPQNEFVHVRLKDLLELTSGSFLRKAWIGVAADGAEYELSCDAADLEELRDFLRLLRQRWLMAIPNCPGATTGYGNRLDGKFAGILAAELDPDEEPIVQYFDTAAIDPKRSLFRKKPGWTPGHLLAATSAGRLLWITDHYASYGNRVASIVRSVPLTRISSIDRVEIESTETLRFGLGPADHWLVPIRRQVPIRRSDGASLEAFVRTLVDVIGTCLS